MKIVGGPHDGFVVNGVAPGTLRLTNPIPQELAIDWLCSACGRVSPVGPTVSCTTYTVRKLSGPGADGKRDCYEFFAPQDWTNMQAFRHQFSK